MEGKKALCIANTSPFCSISLSTSCSAWSLIFVVWLLNSSALFSLLMPNSFLSKSPSGGRKRVTYIASLCNDVTEVKGRWVLLWLCVYLFILGKLWRVAVELVCLSLKRSTLTLVCLKSIHLIPWTESNHKQIMLNGLRDGITWYHLKVMNHISLPGWLLTWIIYLKFDHHCLVAQLFSLLTYHLEGEKGVCRVGTSLLPAATMQSEW